jgi:glycosyltransferase involved in cell wall biosynthesis
MDLSIIIPTKNEEKYLGQTLRSIKDQKTKLKYEIIVADAKSKDKTKKIAKDFGCKIVAGGLPGTGRNNGVKVAKGKVILFLDADTKLPPGFLKSNYNEFIKRNLIGGGCKLAFTSNNLAYKIYSFIINSLMLITQYISPQMSTGGFFVKKEFHDLINGFDEKIILCEDYDYCKRISKLGKIRLLKSKKVFTSPRRFEIIGKWNMGIQYVKIFLYRTFHGEIRDNRFNYQFDTIYKK